jgi:hypothetical protein
MPSRSAHVREPSSTGGELAATDTAGIETSSVRPRPPPRGDVTKAVMTV